MAPLIELYKKDHASLVDWIFKAYGVGQGTEYQNPHRLRRQAIADRLDLYRDNACRAVCSIIDRVYATQEMRDTLRAYVPIALEQNVSRRIVNEVASLYDRPALRILKKDNDAFHVEEKRISLHFVQQEAHRLTNLCNETLLWQFKGVDDKPSFRIVTPNEFDAIPDPRNKLVPGGYLLDAAPHDAWTPEQARQTANYEIWDDTFRYLINAHGQIVDENGAPGQPSEHGLMRIPGVLFHRREPTTCILDASYGEDIKSAHLGVALLNVMIMRLSKSQGENQPILQGNLAGMASGQVMNGERPLLLPPEVVASMWSMKTDPDHYLAVKKDKISSVGASYGLDYQMFMQELGAESGSGKSYQVRREKLTELRIEQRMRAAAHEAMVVELMGFSSDGMRLDFQEQAMPQDAAEEVSLLDAKMRKGLDSPIAYLMRKDPDLDRETAVELLKANLTDFAALIQWVRALNVSSDADAANPGKTPQENGAANDEKQPQQSDSAAGNAAGGDTPAVARA
jgi:hypothetical protein